MLATPVPEVPLPTSSSEELPPWLPCWLQRKPFQTWSEIVKNPWICTQKSKQCSLNCFGIYVTSGHSRNTHCYNFLTWLDFCSMMFIILLYRSNGNATLLHHHFYAYALGYFHFFPFVLVSLIPSTGFACVQFFGQLLPSRPSFTFQAYHCVHIFIYSFKTQIKQRRLLTMWRYGLIDRCQFASGHISSSNGNWQVFDSRWYKIG